MRCGGIQQVSVGPVLKNEACGIIPIIIHLTIYEMPFNNPRKSVFVDCFHVEVARHQIIY